MVNKLKKNGGVGGEIVTRSTTNLQSKYPTRIYTRLPSDVKGLIVDKAINSRYTSGHIEREIEKIKKRKKIQLEIIENIFTEIRKVDRKINNTKLIGRKKEVLRNKRVNLFNKIDDANANIFALDYKLPPLLYEKSMSEVTFLFKKTNLRGGKR